MKLKQIKATVSAGSGDSTVRTAEPVNIKWELTAVEKTDIAINSYENNTKEYEKLTILYMLLVTALTRVHSAAHLKK